MHLAIQSTSAWPLTSTTLPQDFETATIGVSGGIASKLMETPDSAFIEMAGNGAVIVGADTSAVTEGAGTTAVVAEADSGNFVGVGVVVVAVVIVVVTEMTFSCSETSSILGISGL